MFVKFLLDFYIQYFIIVLVLFIVTWHLSASFIRALALLMLGILFPVADTYIPSLWFSSYCKANLKYVNKGPIRNVRGYYAEDSDGLCSVECQPSTFIRGYEYVEGRINKKRKKTPVYYSNTTYFDSAIKDAHGSLYRFSLVKLKFNVSFKSNSFCPARSQYIKYIVTRNKIAHMCVKAEKIQKPSEYKYKRIRQKHKSWLGDITELSTEITKHTGEKIFFENLFISRNLNTVIPVNRIFYINGIRCKVPRKVKRKATMLTTHTLLPKSDRYH